MFIVYYDIFSQRVQKELVEGQITDERLFAVMKAFCDEIPAAYFWFTTHNVTRLGNLLFGVPVPPKNSIFEVTKRRAGQFQDVALPSGWSTSVGCG